MIEIKKYTSADQELWDNFIDKSKSPMFMFKRNYLDYHAERFLDNSLLFLDNEKIIALFPANLKNDVLISHGGLTFGGFITGEKMKQHSMNDCFLALKKYAQKEKISSILYKAVPHVYHQQPAEEDLSSLFCLGAQIFKIEPATVINLKKPFKMPKGRKSQISRAKREGVVVEQSENFVSFIALENAVLKEHHDTQAIHTAEELELLHSRFPERIKLYVGKYEDEIISAVLLYVYDDLIHTQYMAANEKAREIGALDLVINSLILEYRDVKKFLDFGISTENNGLLLNEGLIKQKEGFGGRTIAYTTWKIEI